MANALRGGGIPNCYRLKSRAVYCDWEGGHYHVLEGGWKLGMDLEPIGGTGHNDCKQTF